MEWSAFRSSLLLLAWLRCLLGYGWPTIIPAARRGNPLVYADGRLLHHAGSPGFCALEKLYAAQTRLLPQVRIRPAGIVHSLSRMRNHHVGSAPRTIPFRSII